MLWPYESSCAIAGKPAVKSAFEDAKFIGIIGSDTARKLAIPHEDAAKERERQKEIGVFMRGIQVTQKHAQDTAGGVIALPVEAFIVAQREGDDLSALKGKVEDRPILATIQSATHKQVSSTLVKKMLQQQKPIDQMVDPKVRKIIEAERLYQE